jgi:hypothetical protein
LAVAKLTEATIVNERNHIARSATIGGHATIFLCGTQQYIARSATIGGRATIFFVVAKLTDATIHQSKKRYGGATILVGSTAPEYTEQENEQRHKRRSDPEYTEQENEQRRNWHSDPEYRAHENEQ